MKEQTPTDPCINARIKFTQATTFLRSRAEIKSTINTDETFILVKSHLKASQIPFTQVDVVKLRDSLAVNGFEEIRIPELVEPSPILVCLATFPMSKGTTIADLVTFIKRNKDRFPDGLNTRISVGDFEGNETHHVIDLDGQSGTVKILF